MLEKKVRYDTESIMKRYIAEGGSITMCPPASVISKYDARFKGIGYAKGIRFLK
jgi:hypothetical protein